MGENGSPLENGMSEPYCEKPGEPVRTHYIVWEGNTKVGTYSDFNSLLDLIDGEINPSRYSVDRVELFREGSFRLSQAKGKDVLMGKGGGRWEIPSYNPQRYRGVEEERDKALGIL